MNINKTDLRLDLIKQITKTIEKLELKESSSNEKIIPEYIERYKKALLSLNSDVANSLSDISKKNLNSLLDCARGYMETSSNYSQEFLVEMSKTEKIIKNI
ncbi:MAG: hypothetical protein GY787_08295 [Alteromonadales bacterium]|nr:hypothetical protein [Alteromonadales bacterium]